MKRRRQMEIHEVLRFFRKTLHFTQKEILPNLDPSVYSRIEGGKQEIKINDIKNIMNTLSLVPEEIFSNAPLDLEQYKYKKLFSYCSENLQNQKQKQKLLDYYQTLSCKNKNLRELSNYLAIKNYFAQFWEEVDKITGEELQEIYQILLNKNYFQHYDYAIILNTIRLFDKKQIDLIMTKVFSSRNKNSDLIFLSNLAHHIILNVITVRIYEKDYNSAFKYISLAKKHDQSEQSLYYRINFKYLENLLEYLVTGDYQYMQRIQEYIRLLKDIGDNALAEQLEAEIKVVIHGILVSSSQNTFPVTLIKGD